MHRNNPKTIVSVLFTLGLLASSQAFADMLYKHVENEEENLCYLSDAKGRRLFEGQYPKDCFMMLPNRAISDGDIPNPHHVLNMLSFRGQEKVVIDGRGKVLYHLYWYDNGPDYVEEGKVRMRNQQGLIGYADAKTGKVLIAPQYVCASAFENGKALVALKGRISQDDLDHEVCQGEPDFYIDHQGRRLP